jgi:hypothetical protein
LPRSLNLGPLGSKYEPFNALDCATLLFLDRVQINLARDPIPLVKVAAVVSLLLWLVVGLAGRVIGFLYLEHYANLCVVISQYNSLLTTTKVVM